jgi:SAM-dependent methyltransferase
VLSIRPTYFSLFPDENTDLAISETIERRRTNHPDAWSGPNSWVSRFTSGCFAVAPVIAELFKGRPKPRVLEIGCGQGQKALSYTSQAHSVLGIDLVDDLITVAKDSAAKMGVANVEFRATAAADIASILGGDRFDLIMLYAVMEHLTPKERIDVIRTCWAHLSDKGLLFVGESPSRISNFDYHTLNLPFVDTLTNELYLEYARQFSARADSLTNANLFSNDPIEGSYRVGRGLSFHEFDLAFADRDFVGNTRFTIHFEDTAAPFIPSCAQRCPFSTHSDSMGTAFRKLFHDIG